MLRFQRFTNKLSNAWQVVPKRGLSELSKGEHIKQVLENTLNTHTVEVLDKSGGCGSFFSVKVVSPEFKGMPLVKQHMMVNRALAAEIQDMHGLTIVTEVPGDA